MIMNRMVVLLGLPVAGHGEIRGLHQHDERTCGRSTSWGPN